MLLVVPVSNRPMTNSRDVDMGRPLQEFIVTFGVVIGLRAINDPTGERTLAELESLRNTLRESLFGWKPDDDRSAGEKVWCRQDVEEVRQESPQCDQKPQAG